MGHHFIAKLDFSKRTLNALERKGIYVVGSFSVNDVVVYLLSDGRVRPLLEVIAIANE